MAEEIGWFISSVKCIMSGMCVSVYLNGRSVMRDIEFFLILFFKFEGRLTFASEGCRSSHEAVRCIKPRSMGARCVHVTRLFTIYR